MNYYVYIHITPNGKRYVGLTTQKVSKRWNRGRGYYTQKKFYRAILKYGWDNIEHIVYELDSAEEMFYLEKYLILYYDTRNPTKGYNVSYGGEHPGGWHLSEETKQKFKGRKPFLGKKHTVKSKSLIAQSKYKPILQLNVDGDLIKEWASIIEAAQFYSCTKGNIQSCCKGRSRTACGFIWKYKEV